MRVPFNVQFGFIVLSNFDYPSITILQPGPNDGINFEFISLRAVHPVPTCKKYITNHCQAKPPLSSHNSNHFLFSKTVPKSMNNI